MKRNNTLVVISSLLAFSFFLTPFITMAQGIDSILTMQKAINIALSGQQLLKAKGNYVNSSKEDIIAAKRDGLPDFTLSAQQAYGTANGLNGLPSGLPGLLATTTGPVSNSQNWNAAFASLYSTDINWNIFSFGLQKTHVAVAQSNYEQDEADLEQAQLEQKVKVAGGYLNLLAAQRLHYSMNVNLYRVSQLRNTIIQRTVNGLNPGVDSAIANAELSKARIAVADAINYEQSQAANFANQMGITQQLFLLDSVFVNHLPANLPGQGIDDVSGNPLLKYMVARVKSSNLYAQYLYKTGLPKFSFFGVLQDRGSGFNTSYGVDNLAAYSQNYFNGISPERTNYLVGIGVTWNISNLGRAAARAKSQRYQTEGLTNEYRYQEISLTNQLEEGNKQLVIALQKYHEVPIQLKAANDAYEQKKMLYSNGLATIVDVTQTLYDLNRAETDRDIASNAVWQALLYIAASSGDFNLFTNQF